MQLLLEDGAGHTKDPYVQMILEEPEFHSDGTRIVYDALHWALMLGTLMNHIIFTSTPPELNPGG